jgi:hypothetical protein
MQRSRFSACCSASRLTWDRHLTRDEQPSPRLLGVDLLSGEQVWVISQELLQKALGVVGRLFHCDQVRFAIQKIDSASQLLTCDGEELTTF